MNEHEVLDMLRYYARIGVWPSIPAVAKPEQWLRNFDGDDREFAISILENFLFICNDHVEELFKSSFHDLSSHVTKLEPTYLGKKQVWSDFLKDVIVTYPTGELPSVTDSGHGFARKARKLIGISETSIMGPPDLAKLLDAGSDRPIVFVDDFVGSGEQFATTWSRLYPVDNNRHKSIRELVQGHRSPIFYTPLLATSKSIKRIGLSAPKVQLLPAHIIDGSYSALDPDSRLVPPHLRTMALDFLTRTAQRAGISLNSAKGIHGLSTALAFGDCVPDSNIRIVYEASASWTPLMRRT